MLPYYPEDEGEEVRHGFKIHTTINRLVADYANLPLPTIGELDIIDYLILRFDAYVQALSRTKDGQDYLVNAWCYAQTEPDRAGLRKLLAGGAARGL